MVSTSTYFKGNSLTYTFNSQGCIKRFKSVAVFQDGSALVQMGEGVNQANSRLSTTHGHITDCKLDSVVYVGVCVVI